MTECWSEGELRAYVDRELSPGDMQRVAAHLAVCAVCSEAHRKLANRAEQVSLWLEALPESAPVRVPSAVPHRLGHRRRWTAGALALAASIAAAILLLSGPEPPQIVVKTAPHVTPRPQPAAPARQQPVQVKPAIIRRRAPVPPKPHVESYVALDDEPIETGIVVRVALDGGKIPADVIVGSDGRARAIRLVSNSLGGN